MNIEEKKARLQEWGFTCGPRNPRVNTNYPGAYMVIEAHQESELPTVDGRNGPWAIVGDDLNFMIEKAYNVWADEYKPGASVSQ